MSGFQTALGAVQGVDGWLTDAQAQRLYERGSALDGGTRVVEIGSYRGRSAIVLALAVDGRAEVIAIDPHAGSDRGPQQIEGTLSEGEEDNRVFRQNLARAGVTDRIRHLRAPSQAALGSVPGDLGLLYVDGAHRYGPAMADIARWGARVRPGGHMLVHDAFSSVGVTLAQVRLLFFSGRFRYLGRTGSLVDYRREDLDARARAVNALHQIAELPWFARNVLIKLAIVAKRPGLARALGHRGGVWPY